MSTRVKLRTSLETRWTGFTLRKWTGFTPRNLTQSMLDGSTPHWLVRQSNTLSRWLGDSVISSCHAKGERDKSSCRTVRVSATGLDAGGNSESIIYSTTQNKLVIGIYLYKTWHTDCMWSKWSILTILTAPIVVQLNLFNSLPETVALPCGTGTRQSPQNTRQRICWV